MGKISKDDLMDCEKFNEIISEIKDEFKNDFNNAKNEILEFLKMGVKDKDQPIRYISTWQLSCLKENEELIDDILEILLDVMKNDDDQCVRQRAAYVLYDMDEKLDSIKDKLIELLRTSSNGEVRGEAAYLLGKIKDPKTIPLIFSKLKKESNDSARSLIAWSLGDFRKEASVAVPALIDLMKKDKSEVVRWRSALSLGLIGDKKAIPALIQQLTCDNCGDVRSSVANALGEMRAIEALPYLNKSLLNDKHEDTRFEVTMAIGSMEEAADFSIPMLVEAMKNDESSRVRSMAVQVFPSIGNESKKIIPDLIEVLLNDEDNFVRSMTIRTLGKLEAIEALETINFLIKEGSIKEDEFDVLISLARIQGNKSKSYSKILKLKNKEELGEWELRDIELLELRYEVEERIDKIKDEIINLREITQKPLQSEIKFIIKDGIENLNIILNELKNELPKSQKIFIPRELTKERLFELRF